MGRPEAGCRGRSEPPSCGGGVGLAQALRATGRVHGALSSSRVGGRLPPARPQFSAPRWAWPASPAPAGSRPPEIAARSGRDCARHAGEVREEGGGWWRRGGIAPPRSSHRIANRGHPSAPRRGVEGETTSSWTQAEAGCGGRGELARCGGDATGWVGAPQASSRARGAVLRQSGRGLCLRRAGGASALSIIGSSRNSRA